MEKKLTIILSLLLFSIPTIIQAQSFHYGFNMGWVSATKTVKMLQPTDAVTTHAIHTPVMGINAGYDFHKRWSVETNIQVRNEGCRMYYRYATPYINPTEYTEFNLYQYDYYLRIPLLIAYHILPPDAKFGIDITAGPSLGFLMKQSLKSEAINQNGADYLTKATYGTFDINNFDPGIHIGLRARTKLTKKLDVFCDAGRYQGIINILDSGYPVIDNNKTYNSSWNINIGFQYRCCGK